MGCRLKKCDHKSIYIVMLLLGMTFLPTNKLSAFPDETGRARIGNRAQQRPRGNLARPEMRIPKLSPQLEQVLQDWYIHSRKVKKLEGKHNRIVYDHVFHTEKRSNGLFYYEGPGNGHISITPLELRKGDVSRKKSSKGRPYTIKKDHQTKWICDGKRVIAVNDAEKNYELHPLPPTKQGENIMDGPLPFLFGMPPEKAKQRYGFKLISQDKNRVRLAVRPRWKQDAANWSEAEVFLKKSNYLPEAVKLINPAGKLETVYMFHNMSINKAGFIRNLIGRNPFKPPGYPYKQVKVGRPQQQQANNTNTPPRMKRDQVLVPSVVGMSYKKAQEVLKSAGFASKLREGSITENPKLYYHVERQQPRSRVAYQKGQTVYITLYLKKK